MRLLCKLGLHKFDGWIQKEIGSSRHMGIITVDYYLWQGLIIVAAVVIVVLINLLLK